MAVDEGHAEEDVIRAKMIEHNEQVGELEEADLSKLVRAMRESGLDQEAIGAYWGGN
jgi:hypothetical protein